MQAIDTSRKLIVLYRPTAIPMICVWQLKSEPFLKGVRKNGSKIIPICGTDNFAKTIS